MADKNSSLPLKYRPMVFEDLVGQEVISKYLSSLSLKSQAKNIITYGAFGTGKTTSTRIYSRALNCTNLLPSGSPCNECENCQAHINERYSDYTEVDGASQAGIEEIKNLQDIAKVPPMFGKYRIILIDEAQGLSKKAWDTLLKLIEEPPPYLCFLFSTTERDKIRPAIISRCQELEVKTLNHEQSVNHLKKICQLEELTYEDSALNLIAFISKGHPRSLLKNLEQCAMFDDITAENVSKVLNLGFVAELVRFLRGWSKGDLNLMKKAIQDWGSSPQDFVRTLQELLMYMVYSTIRSTAITVNPVFESIPKNELSAFYNWLLQTVSPTIDGGVPSALLNLISYLAKHPVENEISLDILLYSLNQLAQEHALRLERYGKAPESSMVKKDSTSEAPKANGTRGRQFSKVAVDAANRLKQPPAPVPQEPTPAPAPVQEAAPVTPPAPQKVYAHNLDDFGFDSSSPASTVISM